MAHRLAADLEQAGIPVWIAPESIQHGEEWVEAIGRGLDESAFFVVILTPAGVASKWVKKEGNLAVEMEVEGQLAFIPLWREDCSVPRVWRAYQRVPFDGSYTAGLAALRARLEGGEQKPSFQEKTRFPGRRIHEKTGIELIRIPAGPFLYGSADGDMLAHDNEKPQRTIDLPAYWIGRAPVTNAKRLPGSPGDGIRRFPRWMRDCGPSPIIGTRSRWRLPGGIEGRSSGRAGQLGRRQSLLRLGRAGAAERGAVGEGGAGHERAHLAVGRRAADGRALQFQ